jgi:hypothetical protein
MSVPLAATIPYHIGKLNGGLSRLSMFDLSNALEVFKRMSAASQNWKTASSCCGSKCSPATSPSKISASRFELPCSFSQALEIFGKVTS